jgi:plastocyanin
VTQQSVIGSMWALQWPWRLAVEPVVDVAQSVARRCEREAEHGRDEEVRAFELVRPPTLDGVAARASRRSSTVGVAQFGIRPVLRSLRLPGTRLAAIALSWALVAGTSQGHARAGEITGRVRLALAGGASAPAADSVLWIEGALPAGVRASLQPPSVSSRAKRFEPHVLVVTRGAPVSFPNVDPIFHNVFSRTPGSEFDLGLYRRGASKTFAFRSAGLVRLYCNIHAEMAAYVMVVAPEDAFAVAGSDGSFRIASLPPGRHTLKAWHEQAGERSVPVDVTAEGATSMDVVLDASQYRPSPHKNKHGKDYPPATSGVDRY